MSSPTQEPQQAGALEPRACLTTFDLLHFALTLVASVEGADLIGCRFGTLWGVIAFVVVGVGAFFGFGYATCALALFLHRRYTPQCRIGYEAACHVLGHFKRRDRFNPGASPEGGPTGRLGNSDASEGPPPMS